MYYTSFKVKKRDEIMLVEQIKQLSFFSEVADVADTISLLSEIQNKSRVDEILPRTRRALQAILQAYPEDEKEGVKLSDVAYSTLLILAKLYPINDIDPISQDTIHPEDAVVTSSGAQFDIYHLIEYHHSRSYRGSTLRELPDSKTLIDPTSNLPFSPKDNAHIQRVALQKRIEIKFLTEEDKIRTAAARQGFFDQYARENKPRNTSPSVIEVENANRLYSKYSTTHPILYENSFFDMTQASVNSFIEFFEHPRAEEICDTLHFSANDIAELALYHYHIMELFTSECVNALRDKVITIEQFKNIDNGQLLIELTKPECLNALQERRTCFDILKKLTASELREINRSNEYPPLMPELLAVAEPLQTDLIRNYSAVESWLTAGLSLDILISVEEDRRNMLLSKLSQISRLSQAGLAIDYFLENDVTAITDNIKLGTAVYIGLLAEEIDILPGYLSSLSPIELRNLAELYTRDKEGTLAQVPQVHNNYHP